MAIFTFYNDIDDSKLSFAVIVAVMDGKFVFCKHKDRDTYELPGGHREVGESIEATAERELREETGAVEFTLRRVCDYALSGNMRVGEPFLDGIYGALFFAEITSKVDKLQSEIEKVYLFDKSPNDLTYPEITPMLMSLVRRSRLI